MMTAFWQCFAALEQLESAAKLFTAVQRAQGEKH